ncbi:hypothetical protein EW146_g9079 [Bondarzewia mesenterica]|uniref:Nucleoside transporter n=1 Tax=Bondarzewia mesenterica TaxID=1095465 RepID=A0A4S4L9Q2_9AGAM|nr:hypothetical protein EW146_g9079 [Bondarzewia mesenterica]
MHARHRSSSISRDNALYQSIPQEPISTDAALIPSTVLETELDIEEADGAVLSDPVLPHLVDNQIHWILFLFGCAVLLPWNVMITATPYFLSRLEGSPVRSLFSSYLSTSFTFANFSFLAHATATSKKASSSRQVQWTTLTLASLTFLLMLSTYITLPPTLFFTFVLLNAIAQAGAGSYLQTSVVAIASLFGPATMQAVMSGQAAVAIVVSSVQVISAGASLRSSAPASVLRARDSVGEAEAKSAFAFFALSTVFLVACAGANVWLTRMPAFKAIVAPAPLDCEPPWARARSLSVERGEHRPLVADGVDLSPVGLHEHADILDAKSRIWRVAKKNVLYEVAVAYVFVVTLSVFPPLTISVQPTNPSIHPLLFNSIHFLVFSTGDFLGRHLCSYPTLLIWSAKRLGMLSLLRTLFIPLFLACNVQRDPSTPSAPPLINSDVLFMLILLVFGLSNGYVSSLCMMSAGSLEHNRRLEGRKEDVDIAATVASFCLVGGLAVGSMMSFGVKAAVCECNPFTT